MSDYARKGNPLQEGLITALTIGGFLIILGATFGLTPEIPGKTIVFFSDITTYPMRQQHHFTCT